MTLKRDEGGLSLRDEGSPTTIEGPGTSSATQVYTSQLGERIAELYSQGMSLHRICQQAEMPRYNQLLKWISTHRELRDVLEGVRAARALHFEDKALQVGEEACGKDADRVKFDVYKWGAEVNDPSRYGKKVTHAGDASKPITFIISTGFPEPVGFQASPKIGEDGLIIREAKEIVAGVLGATALVTNETQEDREEAPAYELPEIPTETLFDQLSKEKNDGETPLDITQEP